MTTRVPTCEEAAIITTEIPRKLRITQLHVGARILGDTTVTVTQFEITGEYVHYATDAGEFISLPYDEAHKIRVLVLV